MSNVNYIKCDLCGNQIATLCDPYWNERDLKDLRNMYFDIPDGLSDICFTCLSEITGKANDELKNMIKV